jgi:hypothetical protein
MNDLTSELLSRYADGQVDPDEAAMAEEAVRSDPEAASRLEEFRSLDELFGGPEPEEVSDELMARLEALRPVAALEGFEAVEADRPRRIAWVNWAAAAAALILVGIGIRHLTYRPEVVLTEFARLVLNADGSARDIPRRDEVRMRAGDLIEAGPGERVSCYLPGGARVVLLSGGSLRLGDPGRGEFFELERGAVLCTAMRGKEPRTVSAGGFELFVNDAHFGVRVEGPEIRAAGPAFGAVGRPDVTVAVSRGSLEVSDNGERETVGAFERVILRRGTPMKRSQAWKDPLYAQLLRTFQTVVGRELLPGFFTSEPGVLAIPGHRWGTSAAGIRTLVVTDSGPAASARHLVIQAAASRPTTLLVTRLRPYSDRPGTAEAVTVETPEVQTDLTVVSIPLSAFSAPDAGREDREIPLGRSRLVRLELRPSQADVELRLKASLWAARPPADSSEVVR